MRLLASLVPAPRASPLRARNLNAPTPAACPPHARRSRGGVRLSGPIAVLGYSRATEAPPTAHNYPHHPAPTAGRGPASGVSAAQAVRRGVRADIGAGRAIKRHERAPPGDATHRGDPIPARPGRGCEPLTVTNGARFPSQSRRSSRPSASSNAFAHPRTFCPTAVPGTSVARTVRC